MAFQKHPAIALNVNRERTYTHNRSITFSMISRKNGIIYNFHHEVYKMFPVIELRSFDSFLFFINVFVCQTFVECLTTDILPKMLWNCSFCDFDCNCDDDGDDDDVAPSSSRYLSDTHTIIGHTQLRIYTLEDLSRK